MAASASSNRVVLVTGGNQGIGYCIVQQLSSADPTLTVLLGARDEKKGEEAVKKLGAANVHSIVIDIDDEKSIAQAAESVKTKYGGLDVLLNNAGMAFKGDAFNTEVVNRTFLTNYYGTLHTINAFLPLLRKDGKILNVSSMSSVAALNKMSADNRARFLDEKLTIDGLTALMNEFRDAVTAGDYKAKGWPETAYGMSKVGVSILTRIFARDLARKNGITVNSGCPGWCRTSMAGEKATSSADDGAKTFVTMTLMEPSKLTNGAFWEKEKESDVTKKV